jgi:RNA polymerase sigma-70 factor (ECF subfamily)
MALAFHLGEERGIHFFYTEFHPALSFYAMKLLNDRPVAEEIASEALFKTWRMRHKLDSFPGIRAYLYKTVLRDCRHHQRREAKRSIAHRSAPLPLFDADNAFEHLLTAETHRMLYAAIQQLSHGNRRVIAMHFLEGKTTGEIARELKLHPHTVQTQKARGLAALRKLIHRTLHLVITLL